MMLVSWLPDGPLSDETKHALSSVFAEIVLFPITRDLRGITKRFATLAWRSPHVASRVVGGSQLAALVNRITNFAPDAIWLDGVYGALTGQRLAARMSLPLFYRSHNIEFHYMKAQAKLANNFRNNIAWHLASWHLEQLELDIQRNSRRVFDISLDDMNYWKNRGVANAVWLPTIVDSPPDISYSDNMVATKWEDKYDLAFIGNLSAPNNFRGLEWFVNSVLPKLRNVRPSIRVLVAGSNPDNETVNLLTREGITLKINPTSAADVWRSGKVLFNPIQSGSGVNVKSIEMLFHDSHLVTTSVGVRGLPPHVRMEFSVCDDSFRFASVVDERLRAAYCLTPMRKAARDEFRSQRIDALIASIREDVASSPRFGSGKHHSMNIFASPSNRER